MNKPFLRHFYFLQEFNKKNCFNLEQLQLLGQTNTQTYIDITKLKRPSGRFNENKPAAQTAGQTLPNATSPVDKIHPFSKMAVTIEPIQ